MLDIDASKSKTRRAYLYSFSSVSQAPFSLFSDEETEA